MGTVRARWTGGIVSGALALVLVASCFGEKGGNGRKGQNHELDLYAVAPEQGPKSGGTDVLLVGFNFKQDGPITDVLFGTTPAPSFIVQSNNQIDAVTPSHVLGLVDVSVRNAAGDEATLADAFEFTGPPATCVSVTPSDGAESGGDVLTITTAGFLDDFTVDVPLVFFDADPVMPVTPIDASTVQIQTPPSPAPAPISVDVTVEGTGLPETCTFVDGFTYLPPPPPPGCMELIPDSGPLAGGTTVTITSLGNCLWTGNSLPTFGGVPATSVVLLSSTVLVCDTPPGAPPPGLVDVEVNGETAAGSPCVCLLPDGFRYAGSCSIQTINPFTGGTNGGIPVTITGTGYDPVGGVDVRFGTVYTDRGTIVVDPSGNRIDLTLPPSCSAGLVDVTVINIVTQDSCTMSGGFQYTTGGMGTCSIASVTPDTGPLGGGTTVTINGTGFGLETGVLFGNRPAARVVNVSSTQITVLTPAGDAPGPVDVCVSPAGSDSCVLVDGYTYQ